jgi:hypothetical protein
MDLNGNCINVESGHELTSFDGGYDLFDSRKDKAMRWSKESLMRIAWSKEPSGYWIDSPYGKAIAEYVDYCNLPRTSKVILPYKGAYNRTYVLTDRGDIWVKNRWYKFKPAKNHYGYYYVKIGGYSIAIHVLVARFFLSIPPRLKNEKNLVVHHKDENKTNNNVSNLAYVSQRENVLFSLHSESHETPVIIKDGAVRIR